MSDRTSHIFEGAGTSLATTYSSGISATSSGFSCEPYERINVYLTVQTVNSAGIAALYCEFSDDGTTFYRPQCFTAAAPTENIDFGYTKIDEAISYYCSFDAAGKFFRLRMAYVSGTSVVVSSVIVEGKS